MVLVVPLLIYVFREVTHDALIVDPFTVPKRFQEAGLTPEVVANRISDAVRQIEITTQTRMKKDNLASFQDEGHIPGVEIPGTNIALKTVVDVTRTVLGIYPRHVGGDIVTQGTGPADVQSQAAVTLYFTQGRNRSRAISLVVSGSDVAVLVQRTAEIVLGEVNSYVLAAYREEHGQFDQSVEIVQRIAQDPSQDGGHISAAYNLWGVVLDDQEKYDEACAKYRKAVDFAPKNPAAYYNWGVALQKQKKYGEAGAKYRKAIELDPTDADAYANWGDVLDDQGRYDDACARYQKAVDLDPKKAATYYNWGVVLQELKKYDDACAKYQKAIDLDPKDADFYAAWANVLDDQGKYDEARAKYQSAAALAPKDAAIQYNWGIVLQEQKQYDEACAKYRKAAELDPADADAYANWGSVLWVQKKYGEARKKFAIARRLRSSR